ncbi:MAG TPA: polysaccharide pyruvyl transferase family protein [Noviherbaspirillum sp.]|nr:polysaccharide pyruvyl transferase family protein [Noviherbaspirillum sp.]
MKLFYYKNPIGNFGDDLNPWIWDALAPEIFDQDDSTVLVGIGTLINTRAPEKPVKIVFGSGVGYHGFPAMDEKWKFYCVRGPLSAERVGIERSFAISDPAVLLTKVVDPSPIKTDNSVCYMPHHASSQFADWRSICKEAGITYLDPADDMKETVARIRRSKLVIAEAMHAAIVADAFRVPWIPVACYDHILDFKWNDWCQSLQMEYQPQRLKSIWDMERHLDFTTLVKTNIKRGLRQAGIWSDNWTPPVPRTNKKKVEDDIISSLIKLTRDGTPFLSKDQNHNDSVDRLLERLDDLKRDYAKSCRFTA